MCYVLKFTSYVPDFFYLQNLLRIIFDRALGLTFDILRKQILRRRVCILLLKFGTYDLLHRWWPRFFINRSVSEITAILMEGYRYVNVT